MNSLRIYLFSSSISGVPVILELMENLQNLSIEVHNIDILSGRQRFSNGDVKDIYSNFLLTILYKIPKIRTYTRRLCGWIFIKKNITKNDIVVLHFIDPGYIKFIKLIRQKTDNIINHWWGSDLYRSSSECKVKLRVINQNVRKHILVPGMTKYFLSHFPEERHKIAYAMFGIQLLEIIKSQKNTIDTIVEKAQLSIPVSKIIISVAYNGSPGQQHIEIINALNQLPEDLKSRLFLLMPMTYGGDEEYINRVRERIQATFISHKILTNYLTKDDLAKYRILSDITINIQVTDGFSASIRESLYAGNVLIVGNWLPYDELRKWGAFYIDTSINALSTTIQRIIANLEFYKTESEGNSKIIYEKSSWQACASVIIDSYTNKS